MDSEQKFRSLEENFLNTTLPSTRLFPLTGYYSLFGMVHSLMTLINPTIGLVLRLFHLPDERSTDPLIKLSLYKISSLRMNVYLITNHQTCPLKINTSTVIKPVHLRSRIYEFDG